MHRFWEIDELVRLLATNPGLKTPGYSSGLVYTQCSPTDSYPMDHFPHCSPFHFARFSSVSLNHCSDRSDGPSLSIRSFTSVFASISRPRYTPLIQMLHQQVQTSASLPNRMTPIRLEQRASATAEADATYHLSRSVASGRTSSSISQN